jgi:hypothetical protein
MSKPLIIRKSDSSSITNHPFVLPQKTHLYPSFEALSAHEIPFQKEEAFYMLELKFLDFVYHI